MNSSTKRVLDIENIVCGGIDGGNYTAKLGFSNSAQEQLKIDLLRFAWHLSVVDGTITEQERDIMCELLGIGIVSQVELMRIIKNTGVDIFTLNYENEAPPILKIFVAFDLHSKEAQKEAGIYAYESLIGLFEMIGKELISCDDNVSREKELKLYSFINSMETYAKKEIAADEKACQNEDIIFIGGKK